MDSDLEDKIIAEIKPKSSQLPSELLVGVGDDAAVIEAHEGSLLVTSSDSFVEGVHFLRAKTRPRDLGWKSVAVNISDLAAMGADARYCMLSISVPSDVEWSWLQQFITGVKEICAEYNVTVVGGDTTASLSGIFLNVSIIGFAKQSELKLRSAVLPGDLLAVTGPLGSASCVFNSLGTATENVPGFVELKKQWDRPIPHVQCSQVLRRINGVHAMMDVSDGLATDLRRLCDQSNCGALINVEKLPMLDELIAVSEAVAQDPLAYAVSGGEEYCLLISLEVDALLETQQSLIQEGLEELSIIGKAVDQKGEVSFLLNDQPFTSSLEPFNHF